MWTAVRLVFPGACVGCGQRADGRLCAACDRVRADAVPRVEGVRWVVALARYEGGLASALRRAKYGGDRALMRSVARVFAEDAGPLAVGFDAIVPVPSTRARRIRRGFAPASILAEEVARASGVPVVDALELLPGVRQAGLSGRGRRANLRGRLLARATVTGRALLVDDVSTTGATLSAAASELLGGATTEVCAVVLCARPAPGA
jgi:ComF family protein